MLLNPGTVLSGRYEILEKIGSGGMAVVYRGKDKKLDRYVTVKVLREEFIGDEEFIERFRSEACSAARLSHPNIVRAYDVGEDGDVNYIVNEYIHGDTLKKAIKEKAPFDSRSTINVAIQIASSLSQAHKAHIVHRDIKPQNILVGTDGVVKVTDFGIARAATASTMTTTANAAGSVHYFSPEQARGGYVDEKSDIYSLGISMFEMITGVLPFQGNNSVSIALMHINDELPDIRQYNPNCTPSLEGIIKKATMKKADERYANIDLLLADLIRARADITGAARKAQPVQKPAEKKEEPVKEAAVAGAAAAGAGVRMSRRAEAAAQLRAAQEKAAAPKEVPNEEQRKAENTTVAEPKVQDEQQMVQNSAENRKPAQYQDRGQASYGAQKRSNSPYMQQPRPAYNAQSQPRPQQPQQADPAKGPTALDIASMSPKELEALDSGETKTGILEIMPEGFGFIRCDNYLPGENDVYVGTPLLRKYGLRTGDIVSGNTKIRTATEKFSPLLYVKSINGYPVVETPMRRPKFEHLTPIFPNQRLHLETPGCPLAMRMVDIISPIGKGQRGMIVSQPKTGKTTLLKQVAKAITRNHRDMHLIILLIDERPEEVTEIKESIEGDKVEVIYSTFDELPENHKRVSEMVIERAKRLVEHKKDVVILLDSITRLARAYNLTVQASGRTLSGGLDPAALHMPKKFFGAARNMREGGSLTILATALVETGSRMDDVVFEEFKGTGNMELVLNRNLSERRVFPAIDLPKSGTRREDLLLTPSELEASTIMRRALNGVKSEEATENIIKLFTQTRNNADFIEMVKKTKIIN